MEITIKNQTVTLKYSFRAMMIYEKITGTSFNPKGVTEILIYFYSTILGSERNLALTFEEFMNWVDENPEELNEFSLWLSSILARNSVINDESAEGEESASKKK